MLRMFFPNRRSSPLAREKPPPEPTQRATTKNNLFSALRKREIMGTANNLSILQLPASFHTRLGPDTREMIALIKRAQNELNNPLVFSVDSLWSATVVCKEVKGKVCEDHSNSNESARLQFIQLQGVDVIWRLFLKYSSCQSSPRVDQLRKFQGDCLNILRECVFASSSVCEALSIQDDLICRIFDCLRIRDMLDVAASLIEELLALRPTIFDLRKITNFNSLMQGFGSRELSCFSRILAVLIYDPKERLSGAIDQNEGIDYQKPVLRATEIKLVEINMAIIIGVPGFIPRLVQLLSVRNFPLPATNIRTNMTEELNAYISQLEHAQHQNADAHAYTSELVSLLRDYVMFRGHNSHTTLALSVKTIALTAFHIEILFLLCFFLKSKRKLDVVVRLLEGGIMPILNELFDHLDWETPNQPPDEHLSRLHGPGCDCNPDSTLKTQFIRLIHSLCRIPGNAINAARVSTAVENSLKSLPELQNLPDHVRRANTPHGLLWCGTEKSLMFKIIKVFKATPSDCSYRQWLSNSIEIFLRGASQSDQMLVAETGLLEFLLDELLQDGFHCAGQLQATFDLLSELIKFNEPLTHRMIASLNAQKITKLCFLMQNNLVDSNVFLRALLLCFEYFKMTSPNSLVILSSPLAMFTEETRASTVCSLMKTMSVAEITQDNICCMNTAVTYFILARRHNATELLLRDVQAADVSHDGPGSKSALGNFQELLRFWLNCYQKRVRDCVALEQTSQISISEWRATVRQLFDLINNLTNA